MDFIIGLYKKTLYREFLIIDEYGLSLFNEQDDALNIGLLKCIIIIILFFLMILVVLKLCQR